MIVEQIDITTASLNATLDETIYMKKPPLLEETLREIITRKPQNSNIVDTARRMIIK